MSKESIKRINKVYKAAMFAIAVVIAVLAILKNPGHLFTASMVFIFGLTTDFVNPENYDLI